MLCPRLGCIHNRSHLFNAIIQHSIEEFLVAVLQRRQVDVLVQVVVPMVEIVDDSLGLLILGEDDRRQKSMDAHELPLT